MKRNIFAMLIITSLLLTSCNLNAATPTPTATSVPTETTEPPSSPTPEPTFTEEPTDVPTPAFTDTPSVPMVTPSDEPVNCRFGPSTDYAMVGALTEGERTQVYGKTSSGEWWQVQNLDQTDQKCWVAASVTTTSGDFSAIAVVAAPETFVTNVTLTVTPEKIPLVGCTDVFNPIVFAGTIEANGPLTATWHFETQQGGKMSDQTLEFETFGSQDVSMEFIPIPVKKGTYWVKLVVTSPNNVTVEEQYEIDCK